TGLDFAFDYVPTSRLLISGSYSWVSEVVFPNVAGVSGLPMALNAPGHKASLSLQMRAPAFKWSFDLRGRYFDGYPVNSGVYATGAAFNGPGSTSTFSYAPIFAASLLDVAVHREFWAGRGAALTWSLAAENLLNHPY